MVLEKFSLEGKVAVVTGAGGVLGGYISRTLAKAGADLAVTDIRAEPLERTAAGVRQLGRKSIALVADITDSRQVDHMIESAIAEFGKVDILINTAGIALGGHVRKPIWEITAEEWHDGINTNLSSAFFCCRAVGKYLVAQKSGKVINIGSRSGLRGGRDDYMYGCAKSGVIHLTSIMAISCSTCCLTSPLQLERSRPPKARSSSSLSFDSGASNSVAGPAKIDGMVLIERWLAGSKSRRLSIVLPRNSSRTGSSLVGG